MLAKEEGAGAEVLKSWRGLLGTRGHEVEPR